MTENQCITFGSYKIAIQIAKCQKPFVAWAEIAFKFW